MHAPLPSGKIWYEDTGGRGAAVVLLHAGSGSSRAWKHQLSALSAAGFRMIAYDRPGHGKTEAKPSSKPAAEVLGELLDFLATEKAHLVGTAAGAIVALDFGLAYAGRVLKLVLANTHGGLQDENYVALQRRLRPAPQFDALPAEVRELGPSYRAANPEGVREWIALENPGAMPNAVTRNRLAFSALESITAPTLLITGDADLYMPPAVLKMFSERMKNSRSVVIPECGHSAYWEQPEAFNNAVLAFLKSVPGTE